MSKRFNFTIASLNKLEPPKSGRDEYRDTRVPELILRFTSTGTKTFSVAKTVKGKKVRATIGKFPSVTIEQARKKAREMISLMEDGINPSDLKRQERIKQLTAEDIYLNFVENFKAKIKVGERRQKTLDDQSRLWKLHLKHRVGRLTANEITKGKALRVMDKIKADLTAGLYNQCLAVLKSSFNLAVKHELVNENPFAGISKVAIEAKNRFLSKEEIAALFDSLTHEKQIYQDVVQILIYTGQRKGNVYSMEWDELDLDRGFWTIPHTKTKTKKDYQVQLATPAVEILKRRWTNHEKDYGDTPYVFASKQRGNQKGHLSTKSDNSGYWKRIIERAGLDTDDKAKAITPHTMRKTLASWQALEGVDLLTISKSLGHSDIRTTAKAYAHLTGDSVKAGVQKATDAMQAALTQNNKMESIEVKIEKLISSLSNEELRILRQKLMEVES